VSVKTVDLYLVQAPETAAGPVGPGRDDPRDFPQNLLGALPSAAPIKNLKDLINRAHREFFSRQRPIRNLVIACQGRGRGGDNGITYGESHIGESLLTPDLDETTRRHLGELVALRPVFASDAHVFLLSCNFGRCHDLIRRMSYALGGIPVHGYEGFVTATNYLLFQTASDETDDDVAEVICWPHLCERIPAGQERQARDRTWEPIIPGVPFARR
jgi:hypothetical protein